MKPLASCKSPDSTVIALSTLTPLYTGGIGQCGEQLHPSGLLGGIRHFSCLVARAAGEAEFEKRVWGEAGKSQNDTHAKQVGIRWDGSQLKVVDKLPNRIQVNGNRGWFFNQALSGPCQLMLTRRGISDADWQLLLLALRIQIRHATFGAKDQFGLGVMACERLPEVPPLLNDSDRHPQKAPECKNTLWHSRFIKVSFAKSANITDALRLSLNLRYALRNSLRGQLESQKELALSTDDWKTLRHTMMGALGDFGSCTNISTLYQTPNNNFAELRLCVQLKPEAKYHNFVMKSFNETLSKFEYENWSAGRVSYEWGSGIGPTDKKFKNISEWINHLAGV